MNIDLWKKQKKVLKLKYEDIAEISEIPITTIKNIFCGYVRTPRIDTVEAIERALGITKDNTNSVYTAEDYANGVKETKKISITADQEDILDKTNEVLEILGEKGKELIIEFCDMILNKFK